MEDAVTEVGVNNIVYVGGVALNCAANNLDRFAKNQGHYVSLLLLIGALLMAVLVLALIRLEIK